MNVLVLTEETGLFGEVKEMMQQYKAFDMRIYGNHLDLLDSFSTLHPEMIILDIDMVNEQVFKLINVLKSLQKSLNILLIGSTDKIALISNAFAAGVNSYLVKPLSADNVCDFLIASLKLQKNNPSTL